MISRTSSWKNRFPTTIAGLRDKSVLPFEIRKPDRKAMLIRKLPNLSTGMDYTKFRSKDFDWCDSWDLLKVLGELDLVSLMLGLGLGIQKTREHTETNSNQATLNRAMPTYSTQDVSSLVEFTPPPTSQRHVNDVHEPLSRVDGIKEARNDESASTRRVHWVDANSTDPPLLPEEPHVATVDQDKHASPLPAHPPDLSFHDDDAILQPSRYIDTLAPSTPTTTLSNPSLLQIKGPAAVALDRSDAAGDVKHQLEVRLCGQ